MRIDLRKGLNLKLSEEPDSAVMEDKRVATAGLLGRDHLGVRFNLAVEVGDRVRAGEALARDRHRPDIVFTAPLSGTVSAVNRGLRRSVRSIEVAAVPDDGACLAFDIPVKRDKHALRRLMLASGLWTTLRTRPFGNIPDPDKEPLALLITAIDTEPLAPDPAAIITSYADQFVAGAEALCTLYEGPIFLCQTPGADIPCEPPQRLQRAEFGGPHPAGLPGTHIHFLCSIGFDGGEVWYIGYQDVIALGHLIKTGEPLLERTITLAGPPVIKPRTLVVPLGASTDELVRNELEPGPVRVISGSALSGHSAYGAEAFLGLRHRQITVLRDINRAQQEERLDDAFDTALNGSPGPLIPIPMLDRLSPPGVLAAPLMRALLVGDIDRARDLGALELIEEDLALLTYACPSKTDYGGLLRKTLEQLQKEMK